MKAKWVKREKTVGGYIIPLYQPTLVEVRLFYATFGDTWYHYYRFIRYLVER